MAMNYKQIETMRQVRLMITEVLVPAVVAAYLIDSKNPELKYKIANKAKAAVRSVKTKFRRDKYVEAKIMQ